MGDPRGNCGDASCPGWAVFDVDRGIGLEIQRCDACGVFDDDDDARTAALTALRRYESEREFVRLVAQWFADDPGHELARRANAILCANCAPSGTEGRCPLCFDATGVGCSHGPACDNCVAEAKADALAERRAHRAMDAAAEGLTPADLGPEGVARG